MTSTGWDSRFTLGIDEMDEDHKIIIQYTRDLETAMHVGRGRAALTDILQGIISYASMHFTKEEKLMAETAYPRLARHAEEHRKFLDRIQDFRDRVDAGNVSAPIDVLNFLRDWLQHHLLTVDRQYAEHIRSQAMRSRNVYKTPSESSPHRQPSTSP